MSTSPHITRYIAEVNRIYRSGNATEHSYRPALQRLFENIFLDKGIHNLTITNEPRRIACGSPDYIVTKGDIPVGYIEAKDIGAELNSNIYKAQFDRYRKSLNNLIITDYITFQLFENGLPVTSVTIARFNNGILASVASQFEKFSELINHFIQYEGQWIQTSLQLSKVMASKARLMASVIFDSLNIDSYPYVPPYADNNSIRSQLTGFKDILIPNITPKEFSDIYAQTIAYGMFSARLNDRSDDTFTRSKAAALIPFSNPFLRKLFQYIAGYDLDDNIRWIVDDLAYLFNYIDINAILKEFDKTDHDPIIHFYETFLSEYDPALRKSRGVWYTPPPVVKFIVQSVDFILKRDFNLPDGLSDSSKVPTASLPLQDTYHRVQILDPATGTGTFLSEIIKLVHSHFSNQQGLWQNYVHEHLIPRINGFEILMASYAMAHLNINMLLKQTGYIPSNNERLRIYLTNSLDEAQQGPRISFVEWLMSEANEARRIKQNTPVMVVLGNPPYSGESQNRGKWINFLLKDYKKEPSGISLQEKNPKWLNDDYVKFIRYGQFFIDKNGEGILAFINNHSFLDNPTFRGMRYSLLKSFDDIYILDLHGNAKKKETAPDGGADENVFYIQQGVSINIFVKRQNNDNDNPLASVHHSDLYGNRAEKYSFLFNNSLQSVPWQKLEFDSPQYFFVPKNFSLKEEYDKGFSIQELFPVNSIGIVTARDNFTIHYTPQEVNNTINEFVNLDIETSRRRFNLGNDARDWSVSGAKRDLTSNLDFNKIVEISYRPFDNRFTFYTGNSKGFHCMPRNNVMRHFLKSENIGFVFRRQQPESRDLYIFCSNNITSDGYIRSDNKGGETIAPLYIYREGQVVGGYRLPDEKIPNLNPAILKEISNRLGLQFTEEKNSPPLEEQGWYNSPPVEGVGGGSKEVRAPENARGIRNTQNYMTLPYNPKLKERAGELRKAGNLSEVLLWNQVKNKQFKNFDFDRQKIIGNYIVDFYCTNCHTVIEIDGSSHDDKQEYDALREEYLKGLGLEIIHIPDIDVKKNIKGVMDMLYQHPAFCLTCPSLPSPSPLDRKGGELEGNFGAINLFDYIYAILHCPAYRERYKEFLKIDFPRIPYPDDAEKFWELVKSGEKLRRLHLLEGVEPQSGMATFPIPGTNIIEKPEYTTPTPSKGGELKGNWVKNSPPLEGVGGGRVYINNAQYFDNVPDVAWNFYIGGYQPAQKWLKDRKSRTLTYDDIRHYQRIIVSLQSTHQIMNEIEL